MSEGSQRIGTERESSREQGSRGCRPGERRGGRAKGTPNKFTAEQRQAMQETGVSPLDYLLSVMRDENQNQMARLDAAKAAAPYVHPKLSAIEHSGNDDRPVTIQVVTGVPRGRLEGRQHADD